jgi:hypothetical protein
VERWAISSPRNAGWGRVENTVVLLIGEVWIWPMTAPIRPDRNGSAYWGAAAVYPRARRAVGVAESDPKQPRSLTPP